MKGTSVKEYQRPADGQARNPAVLRFPQADRPQLGEAGVLIEVETDAVSFTLEHTCGEGSVSKVTIQHTGTWLIARCAAVAKPQDGVPAQDTFATEWAPSTN